MAPHLTAPRLPRRSGRTAGARWARAAAALLFGSVAACDGALTGVAGTTSTVAGAGATSTTAGALDAALLGRWRRALAFTARDGTLNSSETTWAFAGDGSAVRTVVSRNLAAGLADGFSTRAAWRTANRTVTITYLPPDAGTVRFTYLVERAPAGDVLYLNGQAFARVGL